MFFPEKEKSHRRTVSASDTFSISSHGGQSKSENQGINDSLTRSDVIGQACNSKKSHFIQGLSATWSGKPPKVPKPEQTQIVFDVVGHGLREIIRITQNDLASLKLAVESTSVSSHQIKAAERYLKKLEFHLSKFDELQEKYDVQRKMRDGIRSMAYAYILSHGKERESALHSVHSGYKECNELLCSYESKVEQMMGTFLFEMIGIQGFARMCCGDVFEIVIKHGEQKWKSRGHVLKNNKQAWENKRILFKALFCEPLYIKAVEVRGLGKNVLLGNKYCETKVLFSAYPQQMTVNLNPSGSLKLNLIITWNPVHGIAEETSLFSRPSIFGSQSVLNQEKDINILTGRYGSAEVLGKTNEKTPKPVFDITDTSVPRFIYESRSSSTLAQNCATASPHADGMEMTSIKDIHPLCSSNDFFNSFTSDSAPSYNSVGKTIAYAQNSDVHTSEIWSSGPSANSSECNSIEMASSSEYSCPNICKLQDYFCNLIFSLENICEQYPDLKELYNTVAEIEKLLKFQRQTTYGSDVSISVKNALGCFDFLNSAVDDDFDTINERDEKTSKTPSSEKSFIENGENMTQSAPPSPQPLTCGVEQLDASLIVHLEYCLRLVENLCSRSPLKCLEIFSLDKLRKQSQYFNIFLRIIRKNEKENFISCGEFFLESESDVKTFWLTLVQKDVILAAVEQFYSELEKAVQCIISDMNTNIISKVSRQIICKILDRTSFSQESIITVGQFHLLFINYDLPVNTFIKRTATEVIIVEDLKSHDLSRMKAAFSCLKTMMPYSEALYEISLFLLEKDSMTKSLAVCYLMDVAADFTYKTKVVESYLEFLESENKKIRQGSCAALQILSATSCTEQLSYVAHNDENHEVRLEARMALLSFETGENKYEKRELTQKQV